MTTTSAGALRSAAAIFLLGLLVVWLVRPVGNPCPELGLLPAGSTSSSAPSFAPPLTRTCTYRTADGTAVRKRYVPVVDALALALLAGLGGAAVALSGRGRGGRGRPARAPRRERPAAQRAANAATRAPRRERPARQPVPRAGTEAPSPTSSPSPSRSRPPSAGVGPGAVERDAVERDAVEREHARREREARRRARGD